MENEQEQVLIKKNKTADKKAYMREYMKQYNARRPKNPKPPRPTLSEEQKKENLKICLKKYYNKNRQAILHHKKAYAKQKRILRLTDKLNELKNQE